MTTQKQILNSHSPSVAMPAGRDRGPYSAHYAVNDGYRGWILLLIILVALGGAALVFAQNAAAKAKPKTQYHVSDLASLGGTSSGGNSINDQSWVAGYSRLLDRNRHATLWRNGSLTDLGTLGGPNSSVTWNVKNTAGIIVGISQTATTPEPNGENWSSAAFYSTPNNVGYINLGFVWEQDQMRGLPTFPGGNNGFATGANNLGQVVGWAENGVHDPTCCCQSDPGHQVLQFRPAVWTLGPPDQIHDLPLISGDTSGAATAINDNGQIVGISGICDQAVGRHTAKHAVLKENGIKALKPLRGRVPQHVDSEAYGINEAQQVVGVSCDADQVDCRAVIWDHGVYPTDLNDLKGDYSAFLALAKDINNKGEITGRAVDPATGALIAYLAVP